ncbi:MAG: LPD38 domain-containing protein [Nitrospirales bacterium]|nr:LPD38 domain-containing protein [Nitrospirales bacterium]
MGDLNLSAFETPTAEPAEGLNLSAFEPASPPSSSDVLRGATTAIKQLPQLTYGLGAGLMATSQSLKEFVGQKYSGYAPQAGETTFDSDQLVKEYLVGKSRAWGEEIAKETKATDSLVTAYERASEGDYGALVDWMQYGIGYGGVQVLQMLGSAGVGSVFGKAALKEVTAQTAERLVTKASIGLAAESGGKLTGEALTKAAVEQVASKIGQYTALAATATGMEGGEILGGVAEQSVDEGRSLRGDELAKAWGATLAAGALEFVGDKFGLDLVTGKIGKFAGARGRLARGGILGAADAGVESGTEFTQTLVEEAGKGHDPFTLKAVRDAIDAAGLGAIMGGVVGGTSGALTPSAPPSITGTVPPLPKSGTGEEPPPEPPIIPPDAVEAATASIVPPLPGILDLTRERDDAKLIVQEIAERVNHLESIGLGVPNFLRDELEAANERFRNLKAEQATVVEIPTSVLAAPDVASAITQAQAFVDNRPAAPAGENLPFSRSETFQSALESHIGSEAYTEATHAGDQAALIAAVRNATGFDDAGGLPTLHGLPLRAVAPERLPDTADTPGQLTRGQYDAANLFLGLFGKRAVVFEDHPAMAGFVAPEGGDQSIVFLGSRSESHPLAVVAHELGHLLEGTEAYRAFQAVLLENLDPEAKLAARERHTTAKTDLELFNEISADVKGDAMTDPAFMTKLVARMREKLGDEETKVQARTFLDVIRDVIAKFTERIGIRMSDDYLPYITNLEKIHDALAIAVAEAYLKGTTPTAEKGKLKLSERQTGEGAREVVHPEAVEKFSGLASAQRDKPEAAMLTVQMTHGGGVLNPVVEHVGDLTHRMSHHARHGTAYRAEVASKIERALAALTHPYGFEKEHAENLRNNARGWTKEGKPISTADLRKAVHAAMDEYAAEHRKLSVYNLPQWLAREAAVAVGERRWDDAIRRLKELHEIVKSADYDRQALAVNRDKKGTILTFEEIGEVLTDAEKLAQQKVSSEKETILSDNDLTPNGRQDDGKGGGFDLYTTTRELPVLTKNDLYPHAAIPKGGTVSRQTLEASGYRLADDLLNSLSKIQLAPRKHPEHKRTSEGKYVGAPPAVVSPAKLTKLREILKGLAKEGKAGRFWHEKSSHAILDLAEGNRNLAEKIVGLIAIYSPRQGILGNMTSALTAYYQWANGKPITTPGRSGLEPAYRAEAWMHESATEETITGIKRSNFYKNLMRVINPAALGTEAQGVTVDMWIARAMGYFKTTVGKAQYLFTEREIKHLASTLGWEPQQAQAAVWVAVRSRIQAPVERDGVMTTLYEATRKDAVTRGWLERVTNYSKSGQAYTHHKAVDAERGRAFERLLLQRALKLDSVEIDSLDFSDALKQRTAQISWEATPGKTSLILPGIHGATLGQQAEYLAAVDAALRGDYGQDLIAEKLNLAGANTIFGPGAWQGNITVGAQTRTAIGLQTDADGLQRVSDDARALINLYADIRGYTMSQEGVYWAYPFYEETKAKANGVRLLFGRALDTTEMGSLYRAIMDVAGHDEWAPAYTEDGAFILNFKTEDHLAFQKTIKEAVGRLPDELSATMKTFRSDGDARMNDWKESPHGESYRERIGAEGGPDVLQWSADLRQAVVGVNEHFSERYDWGNPGEAYPEAAEVETQQTDVSPSTGHDIRFAPRNFPVAYQRMADEYDAAPVLDKAAIPAWNALRDDTARRYKEILLKVHVERVTGQPYTDATSMIADIAKGSFKVTTDYSEHPVWTVEENVQFRVVHDYLGHFKTGYDFSLYGEQRAYAAHAELLTDPLAKQALKVEVYGQAAAAVSHDGVFQVQKIFLPKPDVRNFDAEWAAQSGGQKMAEERGLNMTGNEYLTRIERARATGIGQGRLPRDIRFAPRDATPPYGLKTLPKGAKVPRVQWDKDELRENEDALRDDYAQTGPNELEHTIYPTVYRAWVPMDDVPRARIADRAQDRAKGGYDWSEYKKTGVFPPVTIQLHPNGVATSLDDGNHRVRYWREHKFTHVPAWIVDFRPDSPARPGTLAEYKKQHPELKFAPRKQPVFYSALQKVLSERMPVSASGEQVKGILNAPGVKQDEIKWSGVLDYLEARKLKTISRDSLLAWLKKNEVKIVEVMKSGESAEDLPSLQEFKRDYYESEIVPEDPSYIEEETTRLRDMRRQDLEIEGGYTTEEIEDEVSKIEYEQDDYASEQETRHRTYPFRILGREVEFKVSVYDDVVPMTSGRKAKFLGDLKKDGTLEEDGYGPAFNRFSEANEAAYEYFVGKAKAQAEESAPKYPGSTLKGPNTDYRELLLTFEPALAKTIAERAKKLHNTLMGIHNQIAAAKDPGTTKKPSVEVLNLQRDADRIRREIQLAREKEPSKFTSSHWDEENILAHIRYDTRTDAAGKRTLFIEEIQSDWHQKGREEGYTKDTTGWTAKSLSEPEAGFTSWEIHDAAGNYITGIVGGSEESAIRKAAEGVPQAPFSKSWHELALKRMLRLAADEGYDQLAWTTGRQQNERYRLSKYVSRVVYDNGILNASDLSGRKVFAEEVSENDLAKHIGKEAAEKLIAMTPDEDGLRILEGLDLEIGGSGMVGFYDQMLPRFLDKYLKRWGVTVGTAVFDFVPSGQKKLYSTPSQNAAGVAHAIPITTEMKASVQGESQPQFAPRSKQTQTPEFKKWFGDSKVVDTQGSPLVVYHGTTNAAAIAQFELRGEAAAFHFTADPAYASKYAKGITSAAKAGNERSAAVLPVYLKIENPFFTWKGTDTYFLSPEKIKELAKHGFDGVIQSVLLAPPNPVNHARAVETASELVVFSPTQIKSATGNRGTFDSENPDIRFAPRKATPPYGLREDQLPHGAKVPNVDWNQEDLVAGIGELRRQTPKTLAKGYETIYSGIYGVRKGFTPIVSRAFVPVNRVPKEHISYEDEYMDEYDWQSLKDAATLPPATVVLFNNGPKLLEDGNHRVRHWREEGMTHIPAWIVDFRKGAKPVFAPRTAPTYTVPEPTRTDKVRRVLQDKNIDIAKFVAAVKETVADLHDDLNPVLHEEMFHARAAQATTDFLTDELEPLVKDLALRQGTQGGLNAYLHARHAAEANARLKTLNPKLEKNEALSGMSDTEARTILDDTANDKYAALALKIDAIVNKTRDLMVSYGLESEARVAEWRTLYQHYIPLRREGHEEEGIPTGTGRSVRGSMVKERLGSTAAVDEILGNLALAREATITRGEKMRPVIAMAGLLMAHPNKEIAHLAKPAPITIMNPITGLPEVLPGDLGDYKVPRVRRIDPATGVVKEFPDPTYKGRDNVVNFRIKGVDYAIIFNERNERAMEIAKAFKDLDTAALNIYVAQVAKVTRWIASVNTQYNPIFGIINFVRDVPFAMLTLTSTPLHGKQVEVLANTVKLMSGIYQDARAVRRGEHPTSPAAAMWERFEHVGGPTGYRDLFTTAGDRAKEIEKLLDPSTLRMAWNAGGGKAIADWLSDYNKTMENAVRLGVFKSAVDMGISDIQAASYAKNITVNFNKKGQIGAFLGALYAFFNASIQGVARIHETLFEKDSLALSAIGKRVVAGGVALGVIQTVVLALAGFDDQEPPEYIKEKNLVVPLPGGKYVNIPYPLGFNVLPSIGRLTMETFIYGRPLDRAYSLAATLGGALSPVGGAVSWAQLLSPTVTDPLVALGENKDWTGKPIFKEDRDALAPTPGHSRRRDTATPWAIFLSRAINYLSGGTEYKPGIASPTPDAIDYLITQATGGVGREISKTVQVGQGLVTGEDVPEYKVPLYGRFVGATEGLAATRGRFYENLKQINAHELEIKGRLKAHEPIGDYRLKNPLTRMIDAGNQTERAVQELVRQKHLMVRQGASAEKVRLMEERIGAIMGRFNAQVQALSK